MAEFMTNFTAADMLGTPKKVAPVAKKAPKPVAEKVQAPKVKAPVAEVVEEVVVIEEVAVVEEAPVVEESAPLED